MCLSSLQLDLSVTNTGVKCGVCTQKSVKWSTYQDQTLGNFKMFQTNDVKFLYSFIIEKKPACRVNCKPITLDSYPRRRYYVTVMSIFDCPSGLQFILHARLFQTVCFVFLGNYISFLINAKSNIELHCFILFRIPKVARLLLSCFLS